MPLSSHRLFCLVYLPSFYSFLIVPEETHPAVLAAEKEILECYENSRPLDCWRQVENFKVFSKTLSNNIPRLSRDRDSTICSTIS